MLRWRGKKHTIGNVNVTLHRERVPSSEEVLHPHPGSSSPMAHWSQALLWETANPPLLPLLAVSLPTQSLILNSVGCVVTEAPEDLKSAFRIVSGSTSAGGLGEAAEFTLRGSSLSFFTDGLSLSRLWSREDSKSLSASPYRGRAPLLTEQLL